jgi:hypothetical protein
VLSRSSRVALAYYVNPTVVRVRVKAAGIGFVDALKIAGRYHTKDALPFVPGMEFSGTVDEAGEDVTQLKVGIASSDRRRAVPWPKRFPLPRVNYQKFPIMYRSSRRRLFRSTI